MRIPGDRCLSLAVLMLGLGASGCGSAEPRNGEVAAVQESKAVDVPGPAVFQSKPLTDAELESFARQIDSAVAHLSSNELGALLSPELLTQEILQGVRLSEEDRIGFQEAVRDSFQSVFADVLKGCSSGGDYRYVRTIRRGEQSTLLFRLSLPDSAGLNYHELIVLRGADERPRIADLVIWKTGQRLSRTYRIANLESLIESGGLPADLLESDQLWLQHGAQVRMMRELSKSGQHTESLALCKSLPEAFQQQPEVLQARWEAAVSAGGAALAEAGDAYQRHWPDDPSIPFRMLTIHEAAGRWSEMIEATDRIERSTEDAYSAVLKVRPFLELQQIDSALNAIVSARMASDVEPGVYWLQLEVELRRGNHGETVKLLTEMQNRFGLDFSQLEQIPDSAEFLASAEGQRWLAERSQAASPKESDAPTESPRSIGTPEQPAP